jgi:DNA gyrase subunit A
VEKYGDDRRTQFVANDGDVSMEDLIARRRSSSPSPAPATQADQERPLPLAAPGGKGVMGRR